MKNQSTIMIEYLILDEHKKLEIFIKTHNFIERFWKNCE